jgi:hypothetical protein
MNFYFSGLEDYSFMVRTWSSTNFKIRRCEIHHTVYWTQSITRLWVRKTDSNIDTLIAQRRRHFSYIFSFVLKKYIFVNIYSKMIFIVTDLQTNDRNFLDTEMQIYGWMVYWIGKSSYWKIRFVKEIEKSILYSSEILWNIRIIIRINIQDSNNTDFQYFLIQ